MRLKGVWWIWRDKEPGLALLSPLLAPRLRLAYWSPRQPRCQGKRQLWAHRGRDLQQDVNVQLPLMRKRRSLGVFSFPALGRGNAIFFPPGQPSILLKGSLVNYSTFYRLKSAHTLSVQLCAVSQTEYTRGTTQVSPTQPHWPQKSLLSPLPGTTGHR